MPPLANEFNLREWACIAQGGHRTGNQMRSHGHWSAQQSIQWNEYQCETCGVWVKDVQSIRERPSPNGHFHPIHLP